MIKSPTPAGRPRMTALPGAVAVAAALALAGGCAPAAAAEWRLSGSLQLESRFFPTDPAFAGQDAAAV